MLCVCPQGAAVDYLGALDTPWRVEVSISSGGGGLASMIGNTTVTFVNCTADFSGLDIDRMGNYILDFNITHPVEAANYSLQSLTVNVSCLYCISKARTIHNLYVMLTECSQLCALLNILCTVMG